jgi:hypothetical protein
MCGEQEDFGGAKEVGEAAIQRPGVCETVWGRLVWFKFGGGKGKYA